jgi:PAS domain S-box-containing protein
VREVSEVGEQGAIEQAPGQAPQPAPILAGQTQRLSAAEQRQHALEEELDDQRRTRESLASLGQRLQEARTPEQVAGILTGHLAACFGYQRAVLGLREGGSGPLFLAGFEGFGDGQDPEPVRAGLEALLRLLEDAGAGPVLVRRDPEDPVPGLGDQVVMLFRPRQGAWHGILCFGNAAGPARDHRPVAEKDRDWWRILLGMGASALDNVLLAGELKATHDGLEAMVEERTATLAESREEYRLLYYESTRISENYRSLLDSTADPIVIHDYKGMPTYINPAFTLAFGWNLKDFGVRTFRFIPPGKQQEFEQILDQVAQGETVANLETIRMTRDGRERIVNISSAPYFNAKFDFAGCIFQLRDVTDDKIMEKEYAKIQKLESLGLLAGGIAHDFNNILGGILMNAQVARLQMETGRDAGAYLRGIEEATQKGTRLTRQFLNFARGGNPEKRFSSIEGLLKDSVEFILHGSNVGFDYDIETGLGGVVIDEVQVGQVIQNLVMNAKEAMPGGGVVRIALRDLALEQPPPGVLKQAFRPGHYLQVTVSDDGPGIPPENLGRIFDPYFTTKPDKGGLGLATAHSIMARHHGFLTVASEEGRGATFSLYLPAGDQPSIRETMPMPVPAPAASLQVLGGSALVMDDDDPIRELTCEMLERLGFRVEAVRDGRAALEACRRARQSGKPFDLVIMDLTIPGGMGGRETIAELRKLDPEIQAIVTSGYSNDPILTNYFDFGFQGVLQKPFQLEELKRILLQIV